MGRRRQRGRAVDGILLLDKPAGISSNAALQQVKRIYRAAKAGHTGALDPLATGMLPICLGEATKFSQFLLDADKRYQVTAQLGVRTTTSDADGEVVSEKPVEVSEQQLRDALDNFRGPIQQVPSMYSALKHEGKPLYWYARQGITIDRPARDITIFELELLEYNTERNQVTLDVRCSKGTYIRSLVDDLGELLGCGGHVAVLRRTEVADYPYDQMVTLEDLDDVVDDAKDAEHSVSEALDALLLPMDTAISELPHVHMSETTAGYLLHGQPVQVPGAPLEGLVRMTCGDDNRFIGVGIIDDDGNVAPKRLLSQAQAD